MPISTLRSRPLRLPALLVSICLLTLACDPKPDPSVLPPPPDDPNAVSGQRIIHRRLETGDVVALDNTGVRSTLSVLVPTGDTFEVRPLVARDVDTFQFGNVPQGPYYLKRGTDSYVITEHRQLNLDEYLLGREGVVTVPGLIPVTLSVDGLAPMDAYQDFGVLAPNAGAVGVLSLSSAPDPGGTSLSGWGAVYQSAFGRQEIIDSTKGDRLYVLQKIRRTAGSFNYFATARALTLTKAMFRSDGQASLEGTFNELSPRQLTLDWRRSSFEVHRAAVHPSAVSLTESSVRHSLILAPAVGGLEKGVVGYAGELLIGNLPASNQDVTLTLEYGNPFPAQWGVVASVVHRYQIPVRLRPDGPSITLGVSMKEQAELSVFASRPVEARLSPPTQLQVDGAPAQDERTLGSLTPVFTWEPPSLGTADVYELRIFRLSASSSPAGDVVKTETVATFLTAQRRVRVPPGVLQSKQAYVVRIGAMRTPGMDLTRTPYQADAVVDTSLAEALTSVLSTP
jgi:hypothetical protein